MFKTTIKTTEKEKEDKEKPNFLDMLKLLDNISKDQLLELDSFDKLCSSNCLDILQDIKIHSKKLLRQNNEKFKDIKGYEKVKIYVVSLFVSYVMLGYDFNDITLKIENLLKEFKENSNHLKEYYNLINYLLKIIKPIKEGRYKLFLTSEFLNHQQREDFMTNYYKIKIIEFLKNLNQNYYSFESYQISIEDLLEPIIYIVKNCNKQFDEKYRPSRFSSACYYVFSKIKKLQKINQYELLKTFFFKPIGISKKNFEEHLKRIERNLDYNAFVHIFQNKFIFIEKNIDSLDKE